LSSPGPSEAKISVGTSDANDAVAVIQPYLADKAKPVRISAVQTLLKLQVKEAVAHW